MAIALWAIWYSLLFIAKNVINVAVDTCQDGRRLSSHEMGIALLPCGLRDVCVYVWWLSNVASGVFCVVGWLFCWVLIQWVWALSFSKVSGALCCVWRKSGRVQESSPTVNRVQVNSFGETSKWKLNLFEVFCFLYGSGVHLCMYRMVLIWKLVCLCVFRLVCVGSRTTFHLWYIVAMAACLIYALWPWQQMNLMSLMCFPSALPPLWFSLMELSFSLLSMHTRVCVCVCACMRACACVCVCVCYMCVCACVSVYSRSSVCT